MSPHRSAPELLVLQSLRLVGAADVGRIADRSFLPAEVIEGLVRAAQAAGRVEAFEFGPSRSFVLTEAGQARLRELLAEDLEAAGAGGTLRGMLEDFEQGINGEMVRAVSEWQRAARAPEGPTELLDELAVLGAELRQVLEPLVARLPRFGRYPAQYENALRRARDGEHRWIAGVGILSCHAVWAELHQDLLSTFGRERTPEPRPEEG